MAPLPAGLCGHFGPLLVRFILLQQHQGQVTTDRDHAGPEQPRTGDVDVFHDEAHGVDRDGLGIEQSSQRGLDDLYERHEEEQQNRHGGERLELPMAVGM